MQKNIKKWLLDLKRFDWKMYLALCLLALVPAIYQTIITRLVAVNTNPGALDIIGQMEWFDLINETICAFLIVPMYSILGKTKKTEKFPEAVFKLGILVVGLYGLFSLGIFFYGIHLVSYMNPNEINVVAAYRYLSLETIAFMIGIIYSYVNVVFLVVNRSKYMYSFLVGKILLSLLSDLILIPNVGVEGLAISNIISNVVIGTIGVVVLVLTKNIRVSKYNKNDISYLKMWGKVGFFAGGQQFLDNIIYALMIVRMVNAVSESGNYWVANNFIWGWLLIPITCLSEITRKDAGVEGYNLKQRNYYLLTVFTLVLWVILIPAYIWFFKNVEGIENYTRIFEIVIKNLGFYVFYALSQIPDSIFIGMGKTKYNAINSLICNIVYYGIWFALYQTKLVIMNMDMIIIMFGIGNIVHWVVSITEEKIFLKKELKKQ